VIGCFDDLVEIISVPVDAIYISFEALLHNVVEIEGKRLGEGF